MPYLQNLTSLIRYAESFYGVEYVYGGNTRFGGLDCSGFVCEILKAGGFITASEDYSAQGLYDKLKDRGKVLPTTGALAFFGADARGVSHVGFCVSDYFMIEAGGGTFRTVTKFESRRLNASVRLRPISFRTDLIGCFFPDYKFS